jgi:hypothetical protein
MKPIEKGCSAMVINAGPRNTGKGVTVGNFVGTRERMRYNDLWEVDIDIFAREIIGPVSFPVVVNVVPESMLIRIDGYEEEEKENAEIHCHV